MLLGTSLIPGFVSYFKNIEGSLVFQPESAKYNLIDSQTFRELYIPAYVNLGSFFTGTIGMYLLQLIFDRNLTFEWFKKMKFLFTFVIALFFLSAFSGVVYYKYDLGNSSLFNPLFVILTKSMWGLLGIITYIGLISKAGGFVRTFFRMKFFNILGKLTFSVYLCHLIVIQYMVDVSRQPLHLKLDTLVGAEFSK